MSNQITPNPSVPTQVVQEMKFPKFINNLGIIPTSYKDSMSYYECLAWLCKFLEETVIPTLNENGEAVEELQALYIELNEYVTNYFENLDVQEEINNKLDDMVEAGTLQEIIASYLNANALFCFDTIDDLKAAENLVDGSFALTLGKSTKDDNAGCMFHIVEELPEDYYITLDSGLYAVYYFTDSVNANCFDEVYDAVEYAHKHNINKIYLSNDITITKTIELYDDMIFDGNSYTLTCNLSRSRGITNKYSHQTDINNLTTYYSEDYSSSQSSTYANGNKNIIVKNLNVGSFTEDHTGDIKPRGFISFENCNNILIENINGEQNVECFIWHCACDNIIIEKCDLKTTRSYTANTGGCVWIYSGYSDSKTHENIEIKNCKLYGTKDEPIGINITGSAKLSNVKIHNNILYGERFMGTGLKGNTTNPVENIEIYENNYEMGGVIIQINGKNINIHNNTFNTSNIDGITGSSLAGKASILTVDGTNNTYNNIYINHNKFNLNNNTLLEYFIKFSKFKGFIISNNEFNGKNCIYLSGAINELCNRIINQNVFNCSDNTADVAVSPRCNYMQINNNKFYNCLYAIQLSSSFENMEFKNNDGHTIGYLVEFLNQGYSRELINIENNRTKDATSLILFDSTFNPVGTLIPYIIKNNILLNSENLYVNNSTHISATGIKDIDNEIYYDGSWS